MNRRALSNLKARLRGKVVFVGVGNPSRGDDGFGPQLVKRLKRAPGLLSQLPPPSFFDVGRVPENYLEVIIAERPDTLVLIDTVEFGGPAGTLKVVTPDDIIEGGLSTHNISLKLIVEYLQSRTGADIFILGVQPRTLKVGSAISQPVREVLDEVVKMFN
ncbi:MAG TPA: hydrogenase 3 maturation endopeptidase HyCI [Candidatus Latescibacteria bacterium]|nr:hydrogenase 3 maturation endopeptidase HyCI [Candidatus Latescibacterota bacterium]